MMETARHGRRHGSHSAFTLVEMIAVVLVLGLVTSIGVVGLDVAMRGLFTGRRTLDRTQKAQVALQRLELELRFVERTGGGSPVPDVTVTDGGSRLLYRSKKDGAQHTVERVGDTLRLDGAVLCDNVTDFEAARRGMAVALTVTIAEIGEYELEL